MKLKRDLKGLIKALGHKDKEVRDQAVKALAEIGEAAVEPLITVLANKDLYSLAMEVLGKIGGAAVVPLIAILNNKKTNSLVRERVVRVLGEIRDTLAVGHLIAILNDVGEDYSVRRRAAEVLGLIGDKQAVEPLIAALSDRNLLGRAFTALGEIGDERAVEPLIALLGDRTLSRFHLIVALGKIGDKRALEPIIDTIKNVGFSDSDLCMIAEVLGKIGDERAVEPLIGILQRRPEEFGTITADTFFRARRGEKIDWKRARSESAFMSSLAQLNHQKMRIAAVLALGKIGGIKAAEVLKTTLMDNDPVVQVTALKAWASIKQRSE